MAVEIIQGDALAVLETLAADSFAAIVTSPPYNLGRTNPLSKAGKGGVPRARTTPTAYAGFEDNLHPNDYIAYHRRTVYECLRTLRPDGLMWYVHRRRPDYRGDTPLVNEILYGYPVRSEVIWPEGAGVESLHGGAGEGVLLSGSGV